ncbi:ATP-binding cassette domain-containing protein [Agromyces binzhouensis]|uniref:ATP-binding cassette domain-containing protein n=1 Tax=Agromyces binzhouensis TaxID=1817495 RepID=UPI0030F48F67
MAVLGSNGSGKSTLLDVLTGEIEAEPERCVGRRASGSSRTTGSKPNWISTTPSATR